MAFQPLSGQDIFRRMVARVVARTRLTDLVRGGELYTILAAVAREIDDSNYQMAQLQKVWDIDTAQGEDLDERAKDYALDGLTRLGATQATGSVVFGRSGTTGAVTIPAGTVVRVPGTDVEFETQASATIADGSSSSAAVGITARTAGADGNVEAGTITGMDAVPGVETVTNPAATSGGRDKESDAEFRERIKAHIRSLPRGTPQALRGAVLGATVEGYGRIAFAEVVEGQGEDRGTVWVYVEDGQGTTNQTQTTTDEVLVAAAAGGEERVFLANKPLVAGATLTLEKDSGGGYVALTEGVDYTVNRATGQITLTTPLAAGDKLRAATYTHYIGLVAEAQRIIDGDPDDPTNYPGYRAAGTLVYAIPPLVKQQVVKASVVVEDGYDGDEVREKVISALTRYINGLSINGEVLLSELYATVMAVPGVRDVTFTTPTANVPIGKGEVARASAEDIEITA